MQLFGGAGATTRLPVGVMDIAAIVCLEIASASVMSPELVSCARYSRLYFGASVSRFIVMIHACSPVWPGSMITAFSCV